MAALQNVPGTWAGLPDFGLTELISSARGTTTNPTFNNPAVYAQTGGIPSAQNTSTVPWVQPGGTSYTSSRTSQPAPTSSGGGGGSGGSSQQRVTNNAPGGTWTTNANGDPVYIGPQSGPTQEELEAQLTQQLEESYAPAYSRLNDIQAQYEAEYPTSQAFLEQSYGEVMPQLQSEQDTKIGGLQSQERKGKEEEKSQFATARQKFNELRQSGLTRFGGASSTGDAYGELLGRSTSEEMGGITKNFGQMYQDIEKEKANVNDFYAQKKTNLEREKQLKLQELKNSFDTEIRKINTQRTALDSEKAGRRLAALQEYAAQARQMQYDQQVFQQKLDAWKAQKDETIALAQQFQAKSFTVPSMPGVMGGFSVTGTNQGTGNNTGGYITGQGITGTKEDELANAQGVSGNLTDEQLQSYLNNL